MFGIAIFLSLWVLPSVSALENMSLNPIATRCVSNIDDTGTDLIVRYDDGFKWLSFLAFNLSEIPSGASIDSAVLKVKTQLVLNPSWISAYSSSNADLVETGMSWVTKPNVDDYIDAVWVSTHEEWYTWESWYLTDAVSDAFQETGKLTVMFRSGLYTDQNGHTIFYPNAIMEIAYTLETQPPNIDDVTRKPSNPTRDDEVKVEATVTDSESGVREVNLLYSTDEGVSWTKVTMNKADDLTYSGTIPRQDQDVSVKYYVEAFDNAGNRIDSTRHTYTVWSEEQLEQTHLWALIIVLFIVFGLPIIAAAVIVYDANKK